MKDAASAVLDEIRQWADEIQGDSLKSKFRKPEPTPEQDASQQSEPESIDPELTQFYESLK